MHCSRALNLWEREQGSVATAQGRHPARAKGSRHTLSLSPWPLRREGRLKSSVDGINRLVAIRGLSGEE